MDTFVPNKYSNFFQCLQKTIFPKASHYELIPLCTITFIICKALICHCTYICTNASRHEHTLPKFYNFVFCAEFDFYILKYQNYHLFNLAA